MAAVVCDEYGQIPTKEALEGKHVAYYFSSQAVEEQLEKAAEGQETVRPTPIVKEVGFPHFFFSYVVAEGLGGGLGIYIYARVPLILPTYCCSVSGSFVRPFKVGTRVQPGAEYARAAVYITDDLDYIINSICVKQYLVVVFVLPPGTYCSTDEHM